MNNCSTSPLNVILITIDSLSAVDMSIFGYSRNTTPKINEFSKRCYVFSSMYANSTSTYAGIYSILTGKYPVKKTFSNFFSFLKDLIKSENITSILQRRGYQILSVIAMEKFLIWVKNDRHSFRPIRWRLLFKTTFDITYTNISLNKTFKKTYELLERVVMPFFLWIHVYPPHEPYLPTEMFRGYFLDEKSFCNHDSQKSYINNFYSSCLQSEVDKLRCRYNEQILDVDFKIGEFISFLEKEGFIQNTIIMITSDHGEMFEKGFVGHNGPYLYNPLIRIPLIIYLPNRIGGRIVKSNAQQIDILPTIIDILDFDIPQWVDGKSLKFVMNEPNYIDKPVFSTNVCLSKKNRKSEISNFSVVYEGYKLICNFKNNNCELYNLSCDNAEKHNIWREEKEKSEFLRHLIYKMLIDWKQNDISKTCEEIL